jgi:DNA-binding response OmpR family regulator
MSAKILVVDDSLTIQKVIGITLANSGHQLIECLNENDLMNKLKGNQFDLVLLDFNLSDTKNGYDLSIEIRKALPNAGLIVMLGTFDTVDESRFLECGISDKIVKPFESSKFIKKCQEVIESKTTFETAKVDVRSVKTDTVATSNDSDDDFNLDSWTLDAPKVDHSSKVVEVQVVKEEFKLDPLDSEMEGWGFTPKNMVATTPEEKFQKAFPPEILELPVTEVVNKFESSSRFVKEEKVELELPADDKSINILENLNRSLLDEIDEDASADSFWAVDDVTPVKAQAQEDIKKSHLDDVTQDLTDSVNKFKNSESLPVDIDELAKKLKTLLLPQIESMLKDFCKENAEKVAWEVIPDLAENLIKKELKNISDTIN